MGVYIKHLQAKKVEAIFKMLGLNIEEGDIIEVEAPHGDLIDADKIYHGWEKVIYDSDFENVPTVIEAEGEQ